MHQALYSSNAAEVKRSNLGVTSSHENCAQNIKYMPKTSSDGGNIPFYRKSISPKRMAGTDF